MKITIVWMSWMSSNFVRFHEMLFQTDAESFSFLSWKTKKVLFLNRYFKAVVNIKTKQKLCLLTQFSVKVLDSSSQTKVDEFLFRWEANFVAWVIITSM